MIHHEDTKDTKSNTLLFSFAAVVSFVPSW
jgi:hypothetical protein